MKSSSSHYASRTRLVSHGYAALYLYLVVVISCVHGINCFQRFSEQPKYTEVNPGQDALLTCKVIDKRGTCSWQKDNKPVGIYAKKYEWAARPSSGSSGLHLDLHPPPLQIGGDCSLWIRSATLDFDDGLWECQVTASDFTTQDALTSQPVRLVVRVGPQRPRLEYEGVHVPPGHNITVDSGSVATVKCVSHYGNPPATLKWYLGDQEIAAIHPQTNSTEPDNSRTWSATSVVQVTAMRERHGDILRCLAFHESYLAKSVPVEARMDIRYAPTVRLMGTPVKDLEEDKDVLILRCVADANPPASIIWRRAGRSEISSMQETLALRPVGRRDAGVYNCQAQNSVGISDELTLELDVKYPPKIISAGPDRLTTAPLFSPAAFECVADGNPMPTFKWVQRISHGAKYVERGHDPRLVIDNVTYDYQGEYECRATSFINNEERVAISDPISLQVVGAPQVLRLNPSMHTVYVKRGDPASLSLVVCADPHPHRVAWEWGSLRLEAGSGIDRFRADEVQQDPREDCYLSTLHIQHSNEHDSRPYYLVVENERGNDRHAIHLSVEEPLEMSYLLGIAGGCLAAILILICLCIYAIRAKKCCFKGSSGYKSSDKDSEKADLKSRSDSTSGPQGDSIYTTPAGFHHQHQHQQQQHHQQQLHQQQHPGQHGSPEAMKTSSTATTSAHDDFGNLLWQQEAAEFVEQFPQRRRPPPPHMLALRQSASAGALYKNANSTAPLNKRASGGELLTTHQRHQRDLFSGDLGIPEINTHVGSVVHTFETMALQRRQAEQQAQAAQEYQQQHQQQQQQQHSKYTRSSAPTTSTRPASGHGTSNSKYHQLKRKSHESRLRLLQLSQQQLLAATAQELTMPPTRAPVVPLLPQQHFHSINRSTLSLQRPQSSFIEAAADYRYIDEDYRKNLFGTLPSRRKQAAAAPLPPSQRLNKHDNNNSPQSSNNDDDHEDAVIVNAAFDEIFAGYSGADDDEDDISGCGADNNGVRHEKSIVAADNDVEDDAHNMISLSELDDEVFQATTAGTSTANYITGRAGSTPKRLAPLTHKKGPPPAPPIKAPTTTANNNIGAAASVAPNKRAIVPLAVQKQRANTLAQLFERLKSTTTGASPQCVKAKPHPPLAKIQSDSMLQHKQLSNAAPLLQKYAPQADLHEPESAQAGSPDFLRGSTLSQSFVRQLTPARRPHKSPAPLAPFAPPPPRQTTSSVSAMKQSTRAKKSSSAAASPLRNVLFFPKRSRSSNELLLDDLTLQSRKYFGANRRFFDATRAAADKGGVASERQRFGTLLDSAEI